MTLFSLNAGEAIPGLHVVGINGRLGANQTPSRRGEVLADVNNRLAFVRVQPEGLSVEVMARPISEDVWSTTGTRIDPPWPARFGFTVVIVGERETLCAHRMVPQVAGVSDFLHWLGTGAERSDELCCARVDSLVAWYCSNEQAQGLFACMAEQARREVLERELAGDLPGLASASFWLQRAARDDSDLTLAIAGLRRANDPRWKMMRDAFLPGFV